MCVRISRVAKTRPTSAQALLLSQLRCATRLPPTQHHKRELAKQRQQSGVTSVGLGSFLTIIVHVNGDGFASLRNGCSCPQTRNGRETQETEETDELHASVCTVVRRQSKKKQNKRAVALARPLHHAPLALFLLRFPLCSCPRSAEVMVYHWSSDSVANRHTLAATWGCSLECMQQELHSLTQHGGR